MLLLYIHGFGSSGFSHKAKLLREHFGTQRVLAPSLSYIPRLAVSTLEELIVHLKACGRDIALVGSSLGGYYATYLAECYELKAILVNPAVAPYETLASQIGLNHSYYDLSDYEWVQGHIRSLREFMVERIDPRRYLLMVETGDEVLDYRRALERYAGAQKVVVEGGSHAFEAFGSSFSTIEAFLSL